MFDCTQTLILELRLAAPRRPPQSMHPVGGGHSARRVHASGLIRMKVSRHKRKRLWHCSFSDTTQRSDNSRQSCDCFGYLHSCGRRTHKHTHAPFRWPGRFSRWSPPWLANLLSVMVGGSIFCEIQQSSLESIIVCIVVFALLSTIPLLIAPCTPPPAPRPP